MRNLNQYIKNNGQPHLEYVLDKIRSHSVVAIGEDHWIDAHPQFLCELITASAKDSTANIDAVAVEFGSERYQYLADSLIKSPVYREDLVFKILQYTPDDLGNPYMIWVIHIKNMQMFSNLYGKIIKRNLKISEHVSF